MVHSIVNNTLKCKQLIQITTFAAVSSKTTFNQANKTCPVCTKCYHNIYQCQTFMHDSSIDRKKIVLKANYV